jgi:dephospho-CoA kinase
MIYLHSTKIFVIAGRARTGKDTVAKIIEENIKETITLQFSFYLKEYAKRITSWNGNEETKPRDFLVEIGAYVRTINEDFLINRIMEDIKVYQKYFKVIVISDARLQNELETLKKINAITIKITKETNLNKDDITEKDFEKFKDFDYIIDNNGTTKELEKRVKEILLKEGLVLNE